MANLTKSWKTQPFNLFGPSPATRWNSFKWTAVGVGPGNGCWGMKSAACMGTSSIHKDIFKRELTHSTMALGISCPTNAIFKNLFHTHFQLMPITCPTAGVVPSQHWNRTFTTANAMSPIYANSDIEKSDGNGYLYIYPDNTSNFENQFYESFTCGAVGTVSYTSLPRGSTTWT